MKQPIDHHKLSTAIKIGDLHMDPADEIARAIRDKIDEDFADRLRHGKRVVVAFDVWWEA